MEQTPANGAAMYYAKQMFKLALIALLFTGCGQFPDPSGEPLQDPTDQEDCEDCEDWEVDDGEVDTNVDQLSPCAPQPREDASMSWGEVDDETREDGRLVQRLETTERYDGETDEYRFRWEYDDTGRLTEATTEVNGELIGRSTWSYDGDRPISVQRTLWGTLVERQTWSYEGDRLVGRRIDLAPRGLSGQLDGDTARPARNTVDLHDTYSLRPTQRFRGGYGEFGNPWSDANAHRNTAADEDCYRLPAALGHGYPNDESSYHLGWPDEQTDLPHIGFTYGYGGYAYAYGSTAWYGHAGVATGWPFEVGYGADSAAVILAEIDYDEQGRMTAERLDITSESLETDTETDRLVVERTREFGESGMLRDHVTTEADDQSGEAELRFLRNDRGDLLLRERYRNDDLVAFQNWTFDDATAVKLDVYVEDGGPPRPGAYYVPPMYQWATTLIDDPDTTIEHAATYERDVGVGGEEE